MAESALSLVERLRAALDQAQAHAEKDLWALDRATPGRWEAHFGYNLPYSLIMVDGVDIGRLTATRGALPDGGDDQHAADILLVVRLVRKARERAEAVLRTVAAHRKILEEHAILVLTYWPTAMCAVCADPDADVDADPMGRPWTPNQAYPCTTLQALAAVYFPEAPDA